MSSFVSQDGFGIAWAVVDHLSRQIGCSLIFSTHFHELTSMATASTDENGVLILSPIMNLHVAAVVAEDRGSVSMLYSVKTGPSENSYGIHVAKAAKFPREIVELAQQLEEKFFGSEIDSRKECLS
jgi:DNA mismatch repair protein MSH2